MNHREFSAANYLGISRALLQKMRRLRYGPSYVKLDKVVIYRQRDLDKFLTGHLRKLRSTTQEGISVKGGTR